MRISDWSSDVCSSDLRCGNAVAIVLHAQLRRAAQPAQAEDDGAARWRELGCIGKQIADDLQQPRTIADHPDRLVGNVDRQRLPVPFEQECAGFASLAYDSSAERRVWKECVRPCRSRGTPYHFKKKKNA